MFALSQSTFVTHVNFMSQLHAFFKKPLFLIKYIWTVPITRFSSVCSMEDLWSAFLLTGGFFSWMILNERDPYCCGHLFSLTISISRKRATPYVFSSAHVN